MSNKKEKDTTSGYISDFCQVAVRENSLNLFLFTLFITRVHEAIIHAESLFPEV
jgi:hypothetical protein